VAPEDTCRPPLPAGNAGARYKTVITATDMPKCALIAIVAILERILVVNVVVLRVMGVTSRDSVKDVLISIC